MKQPKFKLVNDLSIANWVKETLYPWDRDGYLRLGTVIPEGFESYISVRNENVFPGYEWRETFNHEKLVMRLMDYTDSPDQCFYGMWHGFGFPYEDEYPHIFEGKKIKFDKSSMRYWYDELFHLENRAYYMLEGTLLDSFKIVKPEGHRDTHEYVNLMWPNDKSWFLAKEIDFEVTLIGGSEELIRELEESWHFQTQRFTPQTRTNEIFIANY